MPKLPRPPHRPHTFGVAQLLALVLLVLLAPAGIATAQQTQRAAAAGQPAQAIISYGYTVLEKRPHSRDNFVQGLQIVGDTLYEGTGQFGQSRLLEYAFPSMDLRRERALPDHLFGEGITRLGNRLYQLTWRSGQVLVYDAESFEPTATHTIGGEGWGLTNDGEHLYYSDGSAKLRMLDPDTLAVEREIEVRLNGQPLIRLNELEWIDGEIWANVWGANQLVRIDPNTGAVRGIVDLSGLLPAEERSATTDVLNGIAWDPRDRSLWVTGKNWPWLYRLRITALPLGSG